MVFPSFTMIQPGHDVPAPDSWFTGASPLTLQGWHEATRSAGGARDELPGAMPEFGRGGKGERF
jgi:hypothetical protein